MLIPSRARLCAELHCLSHDGHQVRTAQHWMDPQSPPGRPRSWLRLVVNGRTVQSAGFFGVPAQARLENFWSSRVAAFAPTALTDDQMWEKLLELARITPMLCGLNGCPGILPVGWSFCLECGRDVHAAGYGGVVAMASKPVIVVDRRRSPAPPC